MPSKFAPTLLDSLILVETLSTVILKWTSSRYRRVLEQHLSGRSIESLSELERKQVESTAANHYNRTAYRKIELVVITLHLPALASWAGLLASLQRPQFITTR